MVRKWVVIAAVCALAGGGTGAPRALAQGSEPTFLEYSLRGAGLGVLVGLSAGYLRYEAENNSSEFLKSGAYGLLAGAGVGLILGGVDGKNREKGLGYLSLRSMQTGGWFGSALGLVIGGIDALSTGETRSLARGAAWGYLAGALTGAVVTGYRYSRGSSVMQSKYLSAPSIAWHNDSAGRPYPVVRAAYHF